jgi:hypothetical protein
MKKLSKETNFGFFFIILSVLIAGATGFIETILAAMVIGFGIVTYCLLVAFFAVIDRAESKPSDSSLGAVNWFHEHADNIISMRRPPRIDTSIKIEDLQGGVRYTCHHVPTMEDWVILGISKDRERVCCAGWPPSIADMADCINFEYSDELSQEEINYRTKEFGNSWL